MEFTAQLIQVLGLLVILAGATMVFVHLITWIFGNKHSQVRIGLESLELRRPAAGGGSRKGLTPEHRSLWGSGGRQPARGPIHLRFRLMLSFIIAFTRTSTSFT